MEIIKNLNIMRVVNKFFQYLALIVAFIATSTVSAQTINEAKQAFNDGLAAREAGNYDESIAKIESCIEQLDAILEEDEENEEADELLGNAEELLPTVKYQKAKITFEAKDMNNALEQFKEALKSGESYGNQTVIDNCNKYLTQIYYIRGGSKYKAKDFEAAVAEFDKALEYDPNFAKAFYYKMAIAKNNDEDVLVKENADKGLTAAEVSNDKKTAEKISNSATAYYLNKGIDAKKAGKYQSAADNFNQAIVYDDKNVNAYYYLASSKNELKSWNDAIEAAKKGIELETSPSENAKIYYELGTAYVGINDNANACSAFKKAAVGQYAEAANYQIQQLGCN